MVGEVNLGTAAQLAPYYGVGDQLHLVFDFSLLRAPWDAKQWAERIGESEKALGANGAWPAWVLSNHDEPRHRTRYEGDEDRARVAAVVLLGLRGTPFLFAGEELGLEDARVDECRRVDPGGRDPCRAPLPWEPGPGHGWAAPPWLPWPPEPDDRNVAVLRADEQSILHLYRRLLAARRVSPALHAGSWKLLHAPDAVLAFERRAGDDVRLVVANFGRAEATPAVTGEWEVDVATRQRREGGRWDGRVAGTEAVVLRPA